MNGAGKAGPFCARKVSMLLHIPQVLDVATEQQCRDQLLATDWADGRHTAGNLSAQAKRNQQLAPQSPVGQAIGGLIRDRLQGNGLFFSAALPKQLVPPLFNRYESGMAFDNHIDNAVRGIPGTEDRIRTDLSATLFLSEPASYDGGELVIEDSYGVHSVKLPAGDLVLYPSTSLHRVEPVTRGVRLASFFWIQSMVRDAGRRSLLFDLDQQIQALRRQLGDGDISVGLTGVYHNLLRQWVEL
jgi:PKHD-type hydroxylase